MVLPLYLQVIFAEEAKLAFREDAKITELIKNEPLVFALNVSFLMILAKLRHQKYVKQL
jgi:hypothetical protein